MEGNSPPRSSAVTPQDLVWPSSWRLGPVLTLENASSPSAVVRGVDDGLRTERRTTTERGPGREIRSWKRVGFELGSSPSPSWTDDFLGFFLSVVCR